MEELLELDKEIKKERIEEILKDGERGLHYLDLRRDILGTNGKYSEEIENKIKNK